MRRLLATLLLTVSMWASPVRADDATALAQSLAGEAADLIAKIGIDAARAQLDAPGGHFNRGEIYVFVIDFNGIWRAYPPVPAAEGQSVLEVTDPDGRPLVREMIALARKDGQGWVNYRWVNPKSGKIERKTTFLKRVAELNLFAASGFYRK